MIQLLTAFLQALTREYIFCTRTIHTYTSTPVLLEARKHLSLSSPSDQVLLVPWLEGMLSVTFRTHQPNARCAYVMALQIWHLYRVHMHLPSFMALRDLFSLFLHNGKYPISIYLAKDFVFQWYIFGKLINIQLFHSSILLSDRFYISKKKKKISGKTTGVFLHIGKQLVNCLN